MGTHEEKQHVLRFFWTSGLAEFKPIWKQIYVVIDLREEGSNTKSKGVMRFVGESK